MSNDLMNDPLDLEVEKALQSYIFDELNPKDDEQNMSNLLPFDYGLSTEDYDAIFKRVHPTSSQWKDADPHSKRRIVNSYKIRQSGCFRIGDLQSGEKPDWRLTQIGEFLIGFYESSPIRLLWPGLEISIPKFFLIL